MSDSKTETIILEAFAGLSLCLSLYLSLSMSVSVSDGNDCFGGFCGLAFSKHSEPHVYPRAGVALMDVGS